MTVRNSILIAHILSFLALFIQQSTAQSESALRSGFIRRFYHGSFLIGHGLYIDGGEYSIRNGASIDQSILNQTIAIDLSKSFSTNASSGSSDVDLTFIDKGNAPNFNQISFWTDPSKRTTYAVGGALSNAPGHTEGGPPPDNQLWKFTQKSGSLGGIWSSVDTSGDPAWDSFIRPEGGLFDSGPVGGFYLGGYINAGTSSLVPQAVGIGNVAVPGMQFFNFTSGKLSNDSSSPGFSATGGGVSGGLVYVPTWGEAGLAVAFGGQDAPDLGAYVDGGAYRSFSNISIWDPATQKWYSQTATGEIPTERDKFCTVGVQGGDKSTFEIFMYAGGHGLGILAANPSPADLAANRKLDEVYVLSLPSFNWWKANYTASDPRIRHTCHAIGRQLINVGGFNPTLSAINKAVPPAANSSFGQAIHDKDQFAQGLKVFDLTIMRWTNNWDSNMPKYNVPDVIQTYYSQRGTKSPSSWTDPGLQVIFEGKNGTTNSPSSSHSSSNHTGAIVGGVVGGVGGALLIALTAFCFWRRKRSKSKEGMYELADTRLMELPSNETYKKYQQAPPAELDSAHPAAVEAEAPPVEMFAADMRHELPAHVK